MEELGNTLHIKGHVHYKGSRDELNEKCRVRDDEIDRLRQQLTNRDKEIAAWRDRFDPHGVCGFDGSSIVMSG